MHVANADSSRLHSLERYGCFSALGQNTWFSSRKKEEKTVYNIPREFGALAKNPSRLVCRFQLQTKSIDVCLKAEDFAIVTTQFVDSFQLCKRRRLFASCTFLHFAFAVKTYEGEGVKNVLLYTCTVLSTFFPSRWKL